MKYTIDATKRAPGRIATEVAVLLMGKNRADFAKNKIPAVDVEVINASAMLLNANKLRDKSYARHSLYPGGLTLESMAHVVETKGPKEVLRRAIVGMLPKNKLRPQMMKNLKIRD